MKIVYCCNSILASGGTERVLVNRVNYLVEKFNYDIYIVTSDEKNNKKPFFKLNSKIKIIPLEINLFEGLHHNFFIRKYQLKKKEDLFLSKLTKVVNKIKPDVLVSMGDHSRGIVWQINYSCKKYVENHFSKKYMIEGREISEKETLKKKIKNFYREYNAKKLIDRYDNFLVLTEEDKKQWGRNEIKVINNPLSFYSEKVSNLENKKIISAGRLEEQKGYDMLIDVWKIVNEKYSDWTLEIYGEGSERKKLEEKIKKLNLEKTLKLKGNTSDIKEKFLESSIYVMSSRYEGFGLVLIEAEHCGLPLVSFKCHCGPSDIIFHGENGFLCEVNNINEMADYIIKLIEDKDLRIKMGKKAREDSYKYLEENIMKQWKELYENIK